VSASRRLALDAALFLRRLFVREGHKRPSIIRPPWRSRATSLNGDHGEGFRMPSGVRKPPKQEPAGLGQRSMGILIFAQAQLGPLWVGDDADGDAASETCAGWSLDWELAGCEFQGFRVGPREGRADRLRRNRGAWLCELRVRCAGSRRGSGGCGMAGRRARLHPAFEGLDDAHAPAAAGTGREPIERI
jgi:hypothetical protein